MRVNGKIGIKQHRAGRQAGPVPQMFKRLNQNYAY